jgi:hypothetical protein
MPAIILRDPESGKSKIPEYIMLELQGDLECRLDEVQDCSGKFVGDLIYNNYGHPVRLNIFQFTIINN